MPRPAHFEIHASDPARAQAFYESVFGWKFSQWETNPYWLIQTGEGPGIDGGLLLRPGERPADDQPVNAFVLTIHVDGCQSTVDTALANGGSLAVPMSAIPGIGWVAYLKDTEGNV